MEKLSISGNIVDVVRREIYEGTIEIEGGKIKKIVHRASCIVDRNQQYLLPGLIDAHIHIESSMAIPSEFAKIAVKHGTVATVSDPHEIANVMGIDGVKYMIEDGKKADFKFYFGCPSCVPATAFETAGAELGIKETEELMKMDEIKYMSEMMNFPGVLNKDKSVTDKINIAKKYGKPIEVQMYIDFYFANV